MHTRTQGIKVTDAETKKKVLKLLKADAAAKAMDVEGAKAPKRAHKVR